MQNDFLIDISLLPENAKSEIVSFYQYILYKYNLEKTASDYRQFKKDFFTDVIMVDTFQKMDRDAINERK
jgi:hypothetical protein